MQYYYKIQKYLMISILPQCSLVEVVLVEVVLVKVVLVKVVLVKVSCKSCTCKTCRTLELTSARTDGGGCQDYPRVPLNLMIVMRAKPYCPHRDHLVAMIMMMRVIIKFDDRFFFIWYTPERMYR